MSCYEAVSREGSVAIEKFETGLNITKIAQFYYRRDAMLARVFATATCPDVCPCVSLSFRHTPVLCLAERKQDREMCTV